MKIPQFNSTNFEEHITLDIKWIIILKELILKNVCICDSKSIINFQDSAPFPLPIYKYSVKRGFLSMLFLTGALRTSQAQPGTR